jgi:MFS transporter, Spinster family, sphingosine-1-phosphate transporter
LTLPGFGKGQAYYGLGVLSIINLLNYLDRYILAGVMAKVQKEFDLTDTEGGSLATTFMLVYMCASPLGGYLGDRMPRKWLISGAVMLWSLATIGSGLATSFGMLVLMRGLTGIGEAGYGTIAPSFISDLFRKELRSRMLSVFYTAIPLGAAAGFIIGGWVGEKFSWQAAFYVGGAPGIALATLALFLPQPARGGMDEGPTIAPVSFGPGFKALLGNKRFWFTTAGLTLMTFGIGGLSNWMPKFLSAERGFSGTDAGFYLGATTVLGGLFGTIAGGFLGDRLDRKRAGGGVRLSAIGLVVAAPLMCLCVLIDGKIALALGLFAAQFFIFLNNGPLNAAIVNSVPPHLRAFAFGISTLTLHLLGDAASPVVIGWISDHSSLGTAIMINSLPVLCGGLILFVGLKHFAHPVAAASPPQPVAAAP